MKRAQGGIALMLVLWVLTLLTVMALALTTTQRTETALAETAIHAARFRASADAAIAYSVLRLTQPVVEEGDAETAWRPDGRFHLWRFAGASLRIRIRDEAALVDLNQASDGLLANLLRLLGLAPEAADALAAAMLDWRDEDDLALFGGAEDADYRNAGYPLGAADQPFRSIEELGLVFGMTPEIYRRLAPELSLDSGQPEPRQTFASPLVLAALQGLSLEQAEEQVAAREQGLFEQAQPVAAFERGGPLYRIEVSLLEQGRPSASMEALVEVLNDQPPYLVRWRRYGIEPARPEQALELAP